MKILIELTYSRKLIPAKIFPTGYMGRQKNPNNLHMSLPSTSQLTFTFSKSTIETLEKDVKYMFKVNIKNTTTTSMKFKIVI